MASDAASATDNPIYFANGHEEILLGLRQLADRTRDDGQTDAAATPSKGSSRKRKKKLSFKEFISNSLGRKRNSSSSSASAPKRDRTQSCNDSTLSSDVDRSLASLVRSTSLDSTSVHSSSFEAATTGRAHYYYNDSAMLLAMSSPSGLMKASNSDSSTYLIPNASPPYLPHKVCSQPPLKRVDVAIILSAACRVSLDWSQYLATTCKEGFGMEVMCCSVESFLEMSATSKRRRIPVRLEEDLAHAHVQILILGPAFLDWLFSNPSVMIGMLLNPKRLLPLLLGINRADVDLIHQKPLMSFDQWNTVPIVDQSEDFVKGLLNRVARIRGESAGAILPEAASSSPSFAAFSPSASRQSSESAGDEGISKTQDYLPMAASKPRSLSARSLSDAPRWAESKPRTEKAHSFGNERFAPEECVRRPKSRLEIIESYVENVSQPTSRY